MRSCLSLHPSVTAIVSCVWSVRTSSLNPGAGEAMFSDGGRKGWCQQDDCCRGLRGKGVWSQLGFSVKPSHIVTIYGSSGLVKRKGTVRQAVRGRGIPRVSTNIRVTQVNWWKQLPLVSVCEHERDVHEVCFPNLKWVFWVPLSNVKMP